jgi:hypothetical protein
MNTWMTRSVAGIVLATFFSDVGHEMVTAVLPLYLTTIGLGPAALGVMEGLADLLFSVSKLGGGLVGHHSAKKRPWATLGYLTTTLGTGDPPILGGHMAWSALPICLVQWQDHSSQSYWCGRGWRFRW